ncbi:MAG: hypothetical protein FWD44_00160 [Oscillospiraceae bacterium]|nr:hypothetical protein [Oscillospiraceae bacterium]
MTFKENLCKELKEELGIRINENRIIILGGYNNVITYELVVLSGIFITESSLFSIQKYAVQNNDIDANGIYMGTFDDIIEYYKSNPDYFAGGARTVSYNFQSYPDLMSRVDKFIRSI